MILLSLIVLHLVGGIAAWALGKHRIACRIACLVALGIFLASILYLGWGGRELAMAATIGAAGNLTASQTLAVSVAVAAARRSGMTI